MRVIETKVYGIAEHPNKDLCYEWIRDNWHGMNQHSVDEAIESLKELKLIQLVNIFNMLIKLKEILLQNCLVFMKKWVLNTPVV